MRRCYTCLIFALIAPGLRCPLTHAQVISNPSFEGTAQIGVAPPGWTPCNANSTPDTHAAFSAIWSVVNLPSDGSSFIGLVARGPGTAFPGSVEAVQAQLTIPAPVGTTIRFKLDLARSASLFDGSLFYTEPLFFRVYGASVSCEKKELLWESTLIDHTEWRTYTIDAVTTFPMSYLILEPVQRANPVSGNVLIDNLKFDYCAFVGPVTSVGVNPVICEHDGTVLLDATTMFGTYSWSNGLTTPSITATTTGKYTVVVSNPCQTKTLEFNVTSRNCFCDTAVPIATVPNDYELCRGEQVALDATTPGGSYKWSTGATTPVLSVGTAAKYTVEVSNKCETKTFSYLVTEDPCRCDLTIPNVFTPNNDKINDTFVVSSEMTVGRFDLRIFDRWGKELFRTGDIQSSWNGTVNGTVTPGVFYWTIDVVCVKGEAVRNNFYRGWVSVVR